MSSTGCKGQLPVIHLGTFMGGPSAVTTAECFETFLSCLLLLCWVTAKLWILPLRARHVQVLVKALIEQKCVECTRGLALNDNSIDMFCHVRLHTCTPEP